jgi:hypothetical protein
MLYSQPKQQKQLLAWLNKNKVKIQSQTTEYIFVKLTPQQLMNATLAQHRALKVLIYKLNWLFQSSPIKPKLLSPPHWKSNLQQLKNLYQHL